MVGARGWRLLGSGTGCRRSMDGKNRAFIIKEQGAETWFRVEAEETQLWYIMSPRRAKERGSEILS